MDVRREGRREGGDRVGGDEEGKNIGERGGEVGGEGGEGVVGEIAVEIEGREKVSSTNDEHREENGSRNGQVGQARRQVSELSSSETLTIHDPGEEAKRERGFARRRVSTNFSSSRFETHKVVKLVPPSPVGKLVPNTALYLSVKLWRLVVWEKAELGMGVVMEVDSMVREVSLERE